MSLSVIDALISSVQATPTATPAANCQARRLRVRTR